MKRIVVLGGYGGFGGRIARRLAACSEFEVVVAGRSLERANGFCAAHPNLRLVPARLDRNTGLEPDLAALAPWLVVDSAGPFQGADYAVPRACIALGAHYLDIADGRAFVAGIGALNAAAVEAGVTVISGASSVPALSSAVVDALAEGMSEVTRVELLISASQRATAGRSVVDAILSYVGQTIAVRQGGVERSVVGWQGLVRRTLAVSGRRPLRDRLAALCDVPDLELLPERYPGRPLVLFRAGAELGVQNRALWLLSLPVRWGWVRSLRGLTRLAVRLLRVMAGLGSDRSGMLVELTGWEGDRRSSGGGP